MERFAYRLEWKLPSSRRVEAAVEEEEIHSRESSWHQGYGGGNVITDFYCGWDQAADKMQIKRAKIFNLQPGYFTAGRVWLQYTEVDGHIKISVRKQVDRKWGQLSYPIPCPKGTHCLQQVPHLPKVPQHTKPLASAEDQFKHVGLQTTLHI